MAVTTGAGAHPVPWASAGPLFCGFHRMAPPGGVPLSRTAGVAGIPGQGEPRSWRLPWLGERPGVWLPYQGWGDLQGWVVGASPGSSGGREGKESGRAWVPFLVSFTHSVLQALTFVIFICFTASISAYMAAALLEFFITLAFLFLYATQYHLRLDRLNWPCLVRDPAPAPVLVPFFSEGRLSFSLPASLLSLVSTGHCQRGCRPPRAALPLTEGPAPALALPGRMPQPCCTRAPGSWSGPLCIHPRPFPGSLAHSQVLYIVSRGISV